MTRIQTNGIDVYEHESPDGEIERYERSESLCEGGQGRTAEETTEITGTTAGLVLLALALVFGILMGWIGRGLA